MNLQKKYVHAAIEVLPGQLIPGDNYGHEVSEDPIFEVSPNLPRSYASILHQNVSILIKPGVRPTTSLSKVNCLEVLCPIASIQILGSKVTHNPNSKTNCFAGI